MRLEQLQQFVELAKFNSFNQAAMQLNITAQALGTSITKMEEELGLVLITRDSHGFSFTEKGKSFLVLASSTLEHYYEGLDKIKNGSTANMIKGRISIFSSGVAQELILTKILPVFKKNFPNVNFIIHSAANHELTDILEKKSTCNDNEKVVFFYAYPFIEAHLKAKGFHTIPILYNRPVAFVSQNSPLAKRNHISLATLKKNSLVFATLDPSFPERMGLPKNQPVALATSNMSLWAQTIIENDYIGILASSFLDDNKNIYYPFLQGLVSIKIKDAISATLAMAIHENATAVVKEFSDYLLMYYGIIK